MGEVERVHASYGASFGSYGRRVNGPPDRHPKKHDQNQEHHQPDDAIELHQEGSEEPTTQVFQIPPESEEHLDLSA